MTEILQIPLLFSDSGATTISIDQSSHVNEAASRFPAELQ